MSYARFQRRPTIAVKLTGITKLSWSTADILTTEGVSDSLDCELYAQIFVDQSGVARVYEERWNGISQDAYLGAAASYTHHRPTAQSLLRHNSL